MPGAESPRHRALCIGVRALLRRNPEGQSGLATGEHVARVVRKQKELPLRVCARSLRRASEPGRADLQPSVRQRDIHESRRPDHSTISTSNGDEWQAHSARLLRERHLDVVAHVRE